MLPPDSIFVKPERKASEIIQVGKRAREKNPTTPTPRTRTRTRTGRKRKRSNRRRRRRAFSPAGEPCEVPPRLFRNELPPPHRREGHERSDRPLWPQRVFAPSAHFGSTRAATRRRSRVDDADGGVGRRRRQVSTVVAVACVWPCNLPQ